MEKTIYKRKKYVWCGSCDELVEKITEHIMDALENRHGLVGDIDFAVEDIPTQEEWEKLNYVGQKAAYRNTTGRYGIKEVGQMFDDSDCFMLIGNFWTGNCLSASKVFDFDTDEEHVEEHVGKLVDDLLVGEDHDEGRYLLRIDQFFERKMPEKK